MKPYVICHMCTTIDGKIIVKRWRKQPVAPNGASLFEWTADQFGIGAWLVGTTTMKEFQGRQVPLKPAPHRIEPGDFVANPKARRFAIGVDAKAVLRFQQPEVDGDHVVLLLTDKASNAYRAHLRNAGVSYLICGRKEVDLRVALDKLCRQFGIKKLMLEGGGKFNGSMLHAGLVDEISQVVIPMVDGGIGIPSMFDIPGDPPPKAAATLTLRSHKKLSGGVNWFRYRVGKSSKR